MRNKYHTQRLKSARDSEIIQHSHDNMENRGNAFSVRSNIYGALDRIMQKKGIQKNTTNLRRDRGSKHLCSDIHRILRSRHKK